MTKKKQNNAEFKKAIPVLQRIINAGHEAYFVGGSVRDYLLNLEVNDVDIATSAQPHEMKKIFSRTIDVGIEHGTLLILHKNEEYEITTFRTESTYEDFRRPDSVTFVRSLKEDLKRRDFTMNAIAMDIHGEIIDPYHGISDLEAGVIRAVGNPNERFNEDALRMMRAVRFSGQLNFTIEKETQSSINKNAHLLENIAIERIQIEFQKLMTSKWRSRGLRSFVETNLYLYCPELDNKKDALLALINDKHIFQDIASAWAILIYKIDKLELVEAFNPVFFLKSWKLSNQMIHDANKIYKGLKFRINHRGLDEWEIFQLGKNFALKVEVLVGYLQNENQSEQVKKIIEKLPIKNEKELQITGYDLMKETKAKPDRWISLALEVALKNVVYGHIENNKAAIIKYLSKNNFIPSE